MSRRDNVFLDGDDDAVPLRSDLYELLDRINKKSSNNDSPSSGSGNNSNNNSNNNNSNNNNSGNGSNRSNGSNRTHVLDSSNHNNNHSNHHNNQQLWELIRVWFTRHSELEAHEAASYRAKDGTTALHLACQKNAPFDILAKVISACPNILEWDDEFGWLPLHYACHHGVSEDILQTLIARNPSTVRVTDTKGRNPLHFAVGNVGKTRAAFPSAIFNSLSKHGAAKVADVTGKLPLHYACAYGASRNVLEILINADPRAVICADLKGLMPLHYAMGNCDRADSPDIVQLLLETEPSMVKMDFDHKIHPLFLLSERANQLKEVDQHTNHSHSRSSTTGAKKNGAVGGGGSGGASNASNRTPSAILLQSRENALKAMNLFLMAEPIPTTNFFTALHCLPKWMVDRAVVHPKVQESLNDKISKKFPTAIMMIDCYALLTVLFVFTKLTIGSIDRRTDPDLENAVPSSKVAPLYICAVYFLVREVIQLLSFIHLGLFHVWYKRGSNWLELSLIVILFYWAIVLNTGSMDLESFRTTAAMTLFFFWLNFLNFLRGLLVEFAVFVSGVLHVVRSLGPFMLALLIILLAFMQMFFTVFRQTGYCNGFDNEKAFVDECDPESSEPYRFCSSWRTLLSVYTMLLGEVDESDFESSSAATFLFVVFVFLVVILLANVLIALVTDSYGVIRNERAAIVFWSNRLNFIVEMNVIKSGVLRDRKKEQDRDKDIGGNGDSVSAGAGSGSGSGTGNGNSNSPLTTASNTAVKIDRATFLWKSVLDVFDKDLNQMEFRSLAFVCLTIIRIFIIFVAIPLWVGLGLLCFGALWPHQWRMKLLEQKITQQSNPTRVEKRHRQLQQLNELKNDIADIRTEVTSKLAENQAMMNQMKTDLMLVQTEMTTELRDIQDLMDILYDLHKV